MEIRITEEDYEAASAWRSVVAPSEFERLVRDFAIHRMQGYHAGVKAAGPQEREEF